MAKSLRGWFLANDVAFGISIKDLNPEEQGRRICERYDFDLNEIRGNYDKMSKAEADQQLLNKLNEVK